MMIPKIIHYAWFGGEKSKVALRAIKTWRKKAPEFEIREWNEKNVPVNNNQFLKKALQDHNYAFASDYVRLLVLKKYGGIYLDTDMYLLQSPIEVIENRELVFGIQDKEVIFSAGFIASIPNQTFINEALKVYDNLVYSSQMQPNTELLSPLIFKMYKFDHEDRTQVRDGAKVIAYNSNILLQPSFKSVSMHVGEKAWAEHTKHDEIRIKLRQQITSQLQAGLFRIVNDIGRKIL